MSKHCKNKGLICCYQGEEYGLSLSSLQLYLVFAACVVCLALVSDH